MLVLGHDEARSTREAGCSTTSDGLGGDPSQVRARSPEFARKTGSVDGVDDERPGFAHRIDATATAHERDAPTTSGYAQVRHLEVAARNSLPTMVICVLTGGTTAAKRNRPNYNERVRSLRRRHGTDDWARFRGRDARVAPLGVIFC